MVYDPLAIRFDFIKKISFVVAIFNISDEKSIRICCFLVFIVMEFLFRHLSCLLIYINDLFLGSLPHKMARLPPLKKLMGAKGKFGWLRWIAEGIFGATGTRMSKWVLEEMWFFFVFQIIQWDIKSHLLFFPRCMFWWTYSSVFDSPKRWHTEWIGPISRGLRFVAIFGFAIFATACQYVRRGCYFDY